MNTNTSDGRISSGSSTGQGVVYQKNLGQYSVQTLNKSLNCELASRLRLKQTELPAIGDEVCFVETGGDRGLITAILPRRNQFSRQAIVTGRHACEQVIAANADQIIPVFAAASPTPKWGLLDRYLVAAEAAGLPALICITKTDLTAQNTELDETLAEYCRIGYQVQLVSAVTGQGLEELKQALSGRLSVLVGKSGVGKTSLLNALQPGLGLRVKAVSQGKQGKGLHTTTRLEMFPLEGGGAIVDTPGVREFGLWGVEASDLALFFPEMRPLVGRCKFGLDCQHDEEPGCAIRKAVMNGEISPYRYQSYLKLRVAP
jgi:ribosome biogenesis GTPase